MDSIWFQERELNGDAAVLAVVCDGVGSTRDGAFASSYCTREFQRWFAGADGLRLGLSLRDRALEINREIVDIARRDGLDTATTLSALLIAGGGYVIVHAGDSRIYRLRDGTAVQLTQDDTSAAGRLTACIGRREDVSIHYDEGEDADGQFLICTDGFYKRMEPASAAEELRRAGGRKQEKALGKLAKAAIERGEQDNISAIILQKRK